MRSTDSAADPPNLDLRTASAAGSAAPLRALALALLELARRELAAEQARGGEDVPSLKRLSESEPKEELVRRK
jgi:hypothetical protein